MLSNESISGTEKVSLLFCFSINCVMTILFYLIFSVGIWCPEGDSTPSLIIYIYIYNITISYSVSFRILRKGGQMKVCRTIGGHRYLRASETFLP